MRARLRATGIAVSIVGHTISRYALTHVSGTAQALTLSSERERGLLKQALQTRPRLRLFNRLPVYPATFATASPTRTVPGSTTRAYTPRSLCALPCGVAVNRNASLP